MWTSARRPGLSAVAEREGSGRTPAGTRPHYASRVNTFPTTRLRRLRRTEALRSLVRETRFGLDDVVAPLFACAGEGVIRPVEGLPGIAQRSVDKLAREGAELQQIGRASCRERVL